MMVMAVLLGNNLRDYKRSNEVINKTECNATATSQKHSYLGPIVRTMQHIPASTKPRDPTQLVVEPHMTGAGMHSLKLTDI